MADSYSHFTRPNSNNSSNHTDFLGKLLLFTFFLFSISLFPSQAPHFINQTLLNKFWELFHLMFIGIAVSYGLLGRRNFDTVNHHDSHSYVSEMFHVSSIFEDGFGNSGKVESFNVKNGSSDDNPYEEHVVQTWSSKYVQREPMVVLAQPHCGIEKYGDLCSFIDNKPLGLPVRSLKSRVETWVSPEFGNGSSDCSGTNVMDSSDSFDKSESERFIDLVSEEGKFNDSDVLGSPIPWRSSYRRTRQRVRGGGGAAWPSHFRPLSVDETQLQSLRSLSLHSQSSSQSHSPSSLSPSHCNSSASMSESHSRQHSECDDTLFVTHAGKCFEDETKELYGSKKDDSSSSKEWISGYSLKFDAKRVAPSKASSSGKPVRTFRTFRSSDSTIVPMDGEKKEKYTKKKFTIDSYEIEEAEANTGGFNRQNLGCNPSRNSNREKLESSENSNSERKDEETVSGTFSVAGNDTCEVDRKAGEFIAKFREQIRLQRTTSADTQKRLNMSGNFFR